MTTIAITSDLAPLPGQTVDRLTNEIESPVDFVEYMLRGMSMNDLGKVESMLRAELDCRHWAETECPW